MDMFIDLADTKQIPQGQESKAGKYDEETDGGALQGWRKLTEIV